jgi:hypothetical protein
VIGRILRRRRDSAERGQALVELGLILPVLVMLVVGTLEFGFVFDHHLTLKYATREGARAGAALANGGGVCGSAEANAVDPRIIAAVQRVLTSPGSPVDIGEVQEIRIYNAGLDGEELATNVWRFSAGMGPTVDGLPLNFVQHSVAWSACNRNNTAVNTQSLGVALTYTYDYRTPYRFLLGDNGLTMTDRTVMQLNPTN